MRVVALFLLAACGARDELVPLLRELAPGHFGACHFPEEKKALITG